MNSEHTTDKHKKCDFVSTQCSKLYATSFLQFTLYTAFTLFFFDTVTLQQATV